MMRLRLLLVINLVLILVGTSYPAYSWNNGQGAVYVIGQADFVSKSSGTTATTLSSPKDAALDLIHGKLYVLDGGNNRVLRYAYPITGNQPAAELVFGQPDFTSSSSGLSRNGLNTPRGVAVDATGRLWVSDHGNNRVLYFNNAHAITTNQPDADGVLGQEDFISNVIANDQDGMDNPRGIAISDDGSLYVTDYGNSRVLRFDNAATKENGGDADQVLGQPGYGSSTPALSQSGMTWPRAVALIDDALFVADRANARVLRFDNVKSKADGAPADGVLGQPDFDTDTINITQDGMERPCRVEPGSYGRLLVSDGFNIERVVIFNDAVNKANGANADNVLGQPDFTSSGPATTQNGFDLDTTGGGMAWDGKNHYLLVCDDNNNRVMIFEEIYEDDGGGCFVSTVGDKK